MKLPPAIKAIVAFTALVWGLLSDPVQALILLMFLDVVMGVLAAYQLKDVRSRVALRGVVTTKVSVLGILAVAALVKPFIPEVSIQAGGQVLGVVEICALFFIVYESLSILENAGHMGIPLPAFLLEALREVQGRIDNLERADEESL